MSGERLHVGVIGGGLGGLTLAQGLKKEGISVAVYERDRSPHDRLQGYRIHIEPVGNRALHNCLPEPLWRRYVLEAGSGGNGLRIVTQDLQQIVFFAAPLASEHKEAATRDLSVSRIALRDVLLEGLGDDVRFGRSFTRYERFPDGRVGAYFEDGSSAECSLLVGADGGNSRVRGQLLPRAQRQATGVLAIMGKVVLTGETRSLLLPGRLDGAMTVLGPRGVGMFLAMHEFAHPAGVPAPTATAGSKQACGDPLFDDSAGYLFWAIIARRAKYPPELENMSGPRLQAVARSLTADWHPNLRSIVDATDPTLIITRPLYAATPVKPWDWSGVTLLGDAVHSMPPTRGVGGNTALRDADLLREKLVGVQRGRQPLREAVGSYEREMLRYSFAAVRSSLQSMNMMVAENRFFYNAMLRLIARFQHH